MPDLERQITEWRRQMLEAGIKSPVPLDELESHLRDGIEDEMRRGIGAQVAFEVAVERLGCADALKREFKRGRFDIRSLSPVYLRVFCILSVPLLLSMISAFAGEASPAQRYLGAGMVSLIAIYVGGLPVFYRRLFTQQNRLMRVALRVGNWVAVGCPLLAILAVFGIVRLGEPGDLVGLILWSAYAAHAANCLACANYEREVAVTRAAKLAGT